MTALLNIRVNLLGRDAVLRLRQRRLLRVQVALSVALGLGVGLSWLVWQREELVEHRARNAAHTQELARLAPAAKETSAVQQALLAAAQRRAALQTLTTQQQAPAQRWVELAHALPPGVRFKQMKQDGDTLLVTGTAPSSSQVGVLMAAWSAPAQAWQRAELVNLTAVADTTGAKAAGEVPPLAHPEPVAPRLGELDFAIRLLFPPVPVVAATPAVSPAVVAPAAHTPVQP